ncbi:MAG: DUF1559 domain-containing protein [Planctomycetota bacterium]|nr:DUF1559 domain-containing protein [Planctomycetota bacterium]MDA0918621.1 DUF1559 domain-containing protein [Planctomycetota bacterium]MDA1159785.1 DUF1559 domain-containing protein [Planctomycetota bacterium]
MRNRNRSGLTVVEVVVTILILLVLAALLIPAGTHSREPARRSQCKNNLKQIGLSLMNYHDVHKALPPGWIASETKGQSSGFGWNFHILPYFDQAPLFKKFDTNSKLADPQSDNPQFAATILSATRCPSDGGPDQAKSRWIPELGTTNYVGNFGVGIPIIWSQLPESTGKLVNSGDFQGILGPNSTIRIRDVKDGMSNVVLVGERRLSEGGTDWPIGAVEGQFSSYWAGIPNIDAVSPLAIVATATGGVFERPSEDEPAISSAQPGNWLGLATVGNLKSLDTAEGREALPYFKINHDPRGVPLSSSDRVTAGFSSWHTGGCQMVLGDGTVRFISENIDATIYTNLMRRSDGATLGEF